MHELRAVSAGREETGTSSGSPPPQSPPLGVGRLGGGRGSSALAASLIIFLRKLCKQGKDIIVIISGCNEAIKCLMAMSKHL
jgi:hypothetical protein